jgi:hypothetical protein
MKRSRSGPRGKAGFPDGYFESGRDSAQMWCREPFSMNSMSHTPSTHSARVALIVFSQKKTDWIIVSVIHPVYTQPEWHSLHSARVRLIVFSQKKDSVNNCLSHTLSTHSARVALIVFSYSNSLNLCLSHTLSTHSARVALIVFSQSKTHWITHCLSHTLSTHSARVALIVFSQSGIHCIQPEWGSLYSARVRLAESVIASVIQPILWYS